MQYYKGNFILVISRDRDAELKESFMQIWNFFPFMRGEINSLQFGLGFTNPAMYEAIADTVLESDLLAFYTKNKKGILITDTGKFNHKTKLTTVNSLF